MTERKARSMAETTKVMSIVETCRLGSDSMLAPLDGDEDGEPSFEGALAPAYDLLGDAASELEGIADDDDDDDDGESR